jgi:lysophospholipase L1-like esterase
MRRLALQAAAVALIFSILLAAALLAGEAWIRWRRFGLDGIRHPVEFAAGRSGREACAREGSVGGPFAPGCRGRRQGVEIVTNRRGLNDREVDESRPHYRVLVLGDSLTLATGVAQRQAYHAVLEERLDRELGEPGFVELYNHGQAGGSLPRYVREFERALALGPLDAVLVGVSATDLLEGVARPAGAACGAETRRLTAEEEEFHRRGILGRNEASGLLERWKASTGLWILGWLALEGRAFAARQYTHPSGERLRAAIEQKASESYRACAVRMRRIADEADLDLVWAILAFEPQPATNAMAQILRALNEPVVIMFDDPERFAGIEDRTIFPGDTHPSAAVHAVYAERLHQALDELGWLAKIREAHTTRR